jgi:hypothetical protein
MAVCTLRTLAVTMTVGGRPGYAVAEPREPEAEEMKPQLDSSLHGDCVCLPDWRRKPPEMSGTQRGSVEPRSARGSRHRDLDRATLCVYL